MSELKSFTDSKGNVFTPVITTPVFLQASRELNISMRDVLSMNLNIANMLELVWYACGSRAKQLGINRDEFWEECVTLDIVPDAIEAVIENITRTFPKAKDILSTAVAATSGENQNPFVNGS